MASDDIWNLQDLSPEAREAAREAARRHGVPFDQWVQSAIIDSAQGGKDRLGPSEDHAAEGWRPSEPDRGRDDDTLVAVRTLSDRMDDLHGQLDRLTRGASDTAIPRGRTGAGTGNELSTALQVIEDRLAGARAEGQTGSRFAGDTPGWMPSDRSGNTSAAASDLEQRIAAVDQALESLNRRWAPAKRAVQAIPRDEFNLGLEHAVEDIRQRQRFLDAAENANSLQRQFAGLSQRLSNSALRPAALTPGGAGDMQEQLRQITEELHSWRRTGGLQDALLVLHEELSEIGSKLNDAAPRRALEALEAEVHAITVRLDDNRTRTTDSSALAGIEQGLAEVRESLRKYAPAEALATFRDEVRALDRKLEWVEANADGGGLKQLQQSVGDLRAVAAHAASGDALIALADEVQRIADKLDHLTNPAFGNDLLSDLDRRFEALAAELGTRSAPVGESDAAENLVAIVESLAAKMEHLEFGQDSSAALEAISGQLKRLTDRIGSTDARLDHLEQMDRTFSELLDRVDSLRADTVAAAERTAHDVAMQVVREASGFDGNALRQDLDELRESHSRNERHTQDTLEVVHDTLERLIDRLAAVETDFRAPLVPSVPSALSALSEPAREPPHASAVSTRSAPDTFALTPVTPPAVEGARRAPPVTLGPATPPAERRPIDPSLPADHPLEPGAVRPGRSMASAAERIAASEAALGAARPAPEPDARSNFIAAARRAAQAAANMSPPSETEAAATSESPAPVSLLRRLTGRRALMLAAVVLIAAGGINLALKTHNGIDTKAMRVWLQDRVEQVASAARSLAPSKVKTASPKPMAAKPVAMAAVSEPEADHPVEIAASAGTDITPAVSAPLSAPANDSDATPSNAPSAPAVAAAPPSETPPTAASVSPFTIASMQQPTTGDVTGSIGRATGLAAPPGEATGAMPLAIVPPLAGQPAAAIPAGLQSAAASGNAAAAYEIAARYAEGRGVASNMQQAARWFEQAADHGLAPAQYRLGSLYEKGQGVKKDLDQARRLYTAAAAKGNGKAMHNLAVLYSEGIDGKPDFNTAAEWFSKAAARGVADSQYNLGILYVRGLGVSQSLAESYKWFALAALHGDADAGRKRDEIAARLGPQTLEAAQLAVKSFKAEPQPEGAVEVKAPPGGWDSLAPAAAIGKPKMGHGARRKVGTL